MKRRIFAVLFLCLCLSFAAACTERTHEHDWNKYIDYDETYHYKVCSTDASHTEKEEHIYGDETVLTAATEDSVGYAEYRCVCCGRRKTMTIPTVGSSNYTNRIPEERFLKEKISEATAVYYLSDDNGGFGDENYVFAYCSLPDEYTEVEYLEGNGSSYIDTGVPARMGVESEIKYEFYDVVRDQCALGAISDENGKKARLYTLFCGQNSRYFGYGYELSQAYSGIVARKAETVHTRLFQSNQEFSVNGATYISESGSEAIDLGKTMYLFAANYSNLYCMEGRIYNCKIWLDGELVRNYVPCVRNGDGLAGMYDLVTKEFVSGIRTATQGGYTLPTVDSLPEEYRQADFLQADGTQYVDTGVACSAETRIVADVEYTDMSGRQSFGCTVDAGITVEDGKATVLDKKLAYDTVYRAEWSQSGGAHTLQIDTKTVRTETEATATDTILLFAARDKDAATVGSFCKMKLYMCKIYTQGEEVRYFIPVVRVADGEAGLFDCTEKKFYTKAVGNAFELPLTIPSASGSVPSGYERVTYIRSAGYEHFDTGYYPTQQTSIEIAFKATDVGNFGLILFGEGNNRLFECFTRDGFFQTDFGTGICEYPVIKNNTEYLLKSGKNGCELYASGFSEAKSYASVGEENNFVSESPLLLFALSQNEQTVFGSESVYLYSCTLYEGEEKVREFLPVRNTETGEYGLYETVNGHFYTAIRDKDIAGFGVGEEAGHVYDVVSVRESTEAETGRIEYACRYCGKKKQEIIPAKAYEVTFERDEGVKEIRIRYGVSPTEYTCDTVAYSRNYRSYNYSRFDAGVRFEIVLEDGYETESVTNATPCDTCETLYTTGFLTENVTVTVKTRKIES